MREGLVIEDRLTRNLLKRLSFLEKEISQHFLILERLADTAITSQSKHELHNILDEAYLKIKKQLSDDKSKLYT